MSDPSATEESLVSETELALANWVAEIVDRLERGESVDLAALAEAYPDRAEELARVLPTVGRMVAFGKAPACGSDRTATGRGDTRAELGTLGDFRLLREVGRGGMGIVYEAEQISLRRRVALKTLPQAAALDPRNRERFLLEARAAACLHHGHIVPVFAVGSEPGMPYYAMQFIDGCTLAQVLDQLRARNGEPTTSLATTPDEAGPNTAATSSLGGSSRDRSYIRAVAEHGRRAAEALDHAHARGVLHRDIKPANLMLDARGHLWITDFGLACIQGDDRLTLTGAVIGTLRYMSPEQAQARRVVIDGRTDLYSLVASLYELLALRPVFDGSDREEILRKIIHDDPKPLRRLNPNVPPDLETIVHKALRKEPAERYSTAGELAADLGRFLDGRPIRARPPGRIERFGKWMRRNRAVAIPAGLFALTAFVGILGGLVWSNDWLSRHNEQLRFERDRAKQLGDQLKVQRDLAEQRRVVADRHLYAFRLRQADEAIKARKFEKAQEILRDCRPAPGEQDHREFAWSYLRREARKELAVLSERTERVTSTAVSPDGRSLATGDRDGTVRLRDPETGDVRLTLRGHAAPVVMLAFSPDGDRLASADEGKRTSIRLWRVDTGQLLARFHEFEGINHLSFDSKGDHLWVSPGSRGDVWRLERWDVKSDPSRPRRIWSRPHEIIRLPRAGDGPIAAYEIEGQGFRLGDLAEATRLGWSGSTIEALGQIAGGSRAGGLLAVAAGPWIVVWDVRADRESARFPNGAGRGGVSIDISPDDRYMTFEYSGIDRCDIHDLRTGVVRTTPPVVIEPDGYRPRAYSSDGRFLARCAQRAGESRIGIRQLDTWRETAVYPGMSAGVNSMSFTPSGRSLVLGVNGSAVRWNFQPEPESAGPAGHLDEAWAASFSSDGGFLATGSDDTDDPQTLKLWDVETGKLVRGWKPHPAMTSALAFQPGGRILASAGMKVKSNLCLWDAETGNLLATLDGHSDKVRALAFSPDGRLLASAGNDLAIRLWDVAARRLIRTWRAHSDTIRQVAFSPDGRSIASVSNDRTLRLWTTEGELSRSWDATSKIAGVAYSRDGETLGWVQEDGVIQLVDTKDGRFHPPLHSEYEELRCLAFSPDGRTLAASGKSGRIHLWDPASGQELLTLDGSRHQTNALVFSPDGTILVACRHNGEVRLYRSR